MEAWTPHAQKTETRIHSPHKTAHRPQSAGNKNEPQIGQQQDRNAGQ